MNILDLAGDSNQAGILNRLRQLASSIPKIELEQEPQGDIYDVIKILDKYKDEGDLKKLYKAELSYAYNRKDNRLTLKIEMRHVKSSRDFTSMLESEFFKSMLQEFKTCGASRYFVSKISRINSYKFETIGNTVFYYTDSLKVF